MFLPFSQYFIFFLLDLLLNNYLLRNIRLFADSKDLITTLLLFLVFNNLLLLVFEFFSLQVMELVLLLDLESLLISWGLVLFEINRFYIHVIIIIIIFIFIFIILIDHILLLLIRIIFDHSSPTDLYDISYIIADIVGDIVLTFSAVLVTRWTEPIFFRNSFQRRF